MALDKFVYDRKFLADHTIGRAFGAVCRQSVVCDVLYCGGLSVCLSVHIWHPGKMAAWIRMPLGWWLGGAWYWNVKFLVVLIEGEGQFWDWESLGLSIVNNGIVCVRGDNAALFNLLWDFLLYR